MVLQMSVLLFLSTVSIALAYIFGYISSSIIYSYISVIFLYVYIYLLISLYALSIGWNYDGRLKYWGLRGKVMIFTLIIFAYALIYWRHSELFLINGNIGNNMTFIEALFLSISMFVNLGFSYIIPSKSIALITTLEALNGYILLAFFISTLLPRWFESIRLQTETYTESLSKKGLNSPKVKKNNKA